MPSVLSGARQASAKVAKRASGLRREIPKHMRETSSGLWIVVLIVPRKRKAQRPKGRNEKWLNDCSSLSCGSRPNLASCWIGRTRSLMPVRTTVRLVSIAANPMWPFIGRPPRWKRRCDPRIGTFKGRGVECCGVRSPRKKWLAGPLSRIRFVLRRTRHRTCCYPIRWLTNDPQRA